MSEKQALSLNDTREGIRKINELVMQTGRTIILTRPLTEGVQPGTIYADENTGDLKILLKGQTEYRRFGIGNLIATGSITGEYVADESLAGAKLINNSVNGAKLLNTSVESVKLATDAVVTAKIKNLAVTSDKIATQAVTTVKLEDRAVTTTKLDDRAVSKSKLADRSVSAEKFDDALASWKDSVVTVNSALGICVVDAQLATMGNLTVNGDVSVTGHFTNSGNFTTKGSFRAERVYNAVYNDLAEAYVPGEALEPGDIVEIREDGKVYKAEYKYEDATIAGVVSDCFAECFGATEEELISGEKVAVGLIGKVPVKVFGPIKIGTYISLDSGVAGLGCAYHGTRRKNVIGKAIETTTENGIHKALCLIFPN